MLCLGFSGGLNQVHENPYELPNAFTHDGAAVLVEDGRVLAAIEEERLNRIKHSNKFPVESIRFCLESAGASLGDLNRIAFYATEKYCNALLNKIYLSQPAVNQRLNAKIVMRALLRKEFGTEVDSYKISFVSHHMAHATSAFAMSGFEESLVVAIDGYGDFLSGLVAVGRGTTITELETFPQSDSLGLFYIEVIRFIGYSPFDEYKVMGLAPYGNPATFREVLSQFYELKPEGAYTMHLDLIAPALLETIEVRKKGEPFSDRHKDLAASLQEALERIVFHIIEHRRRSTGMRNLCLAGGVAHNCTMNGKLLYSDLFDDIFVQPAAHDAGCALGAALMASHELGRPAPRERLRHVYWGRNLGTEAAIESELRGWEEFLEIERLTDVAGYTAQRMTEGAVVGWANGRSEFGPRALGNRSILADPRPAINKDRINQMVKKREGYRPFAPSVLEEDAREFFNLPAGRASFPFMIFVVNVQEDKRELLGAITHVDGSARLHTVSYDENPEYWTLIKAFKDLTGVPVVLNTSFNNNVEPIVDSPHDAITSFLTTGLDLLVLGQFVARKRATSLAARHCLTVSLPPYARLLQTRAFVDSRRMQTTCEIQTTYSARVRKQISPELYQLLLSLDAEPTIGELLNTNGFAPEQQESLVQELNELWSLRFVRLHPAVKHKKPLAAVEPRAAL
jgi:carbamoyltransferase